MSFDSRKPYIGWGACHQKQYFDHGENFMQNHCFIVQFWPRKTRIQVLLYFLFLLLYLYGAHVTSWKNDHAEELLFVSSKAIFKTPKAIRGGIPICFPQELVRAVERPKSRIVRVIEGFEMVMFRSKFESWPQMTFVTVSKDGRGKVAGLECEWSGECSHSCFRPVKILQWKWIHFSVFISRRRQGGITYWNMVWEEECGAKFQASYSNLPPHFILSMWCCH